MLEEQNTITYEQQQITENFQPSDMSYMPTQSVITPDNDLFDIITIVCILCLLLLIGLYLYFIGRRNVIKEDLLTREN